jgi:hypothetical protein
MPFILLHELVKEELTVQVRTSDNHATVSCGLSGTTRILFPGKLIKSASVAYFYQKYYNQRFDSDLRVLPLSFEIRTPDGQPFTADHVTLDDLRRFRDLRGTSQGDWTFDVHGASLPIPVYQEDPPHWTDGDSRVVPYTAIDPNHKDFVRIAVEETVASKSAPPLVVDRLPATTSGRYNFDLFRVGTFEARAFSARVHKQLTLYDPDGHVVDRRLGILRYPVTLETLDKSRDASWKPRLWLLEAGAEPGPIRGPDVDVSATVVAQTRISIAVLQDRINLLIGERGEKISIYGEMQGTDLLARLVIFDEVSAETIDMHGLLDSVIEREPFDHRTGPPDIAVNVPYILRRKSRVLWKNDLLHLEIRASLHDVKVSYINISIGPSVQIQPSIPALKIDVGVEGNVTLDLGELPFATVGIHDNRIRLEAGLRLGANGSWAAETWIDDVLDIGLTGPEALALLIANAGLFATEEGAKLWIQNELNETIQNGFHHVVEGAMNRAPQVLAALLGDDFTYRDVRIEGQDIVFDYVAPLEPDPKPSSKGYVGIIGRSAHQVGPDPNSWDFTPPTLGDTYSAPNLDKIDHIVMVMMENRSFDHVLGYRAQLPGLETSDGLTTELIEFLNSLEFPGLDSDPTKKNFPIKKLNAPHSDIPPNSIGKRTALPRHVGHSLADVADQLMLNDDPPRYIKTPLGRWIHSPKGFIRNWNEERAGGLKREDVLGYYEADDLPFSKFLAENYAYCEKYFCSHAGPTLPNRMFSLSGDVQYDRTGEAILDNNHRHDDNFYLSRAPTIFDFLTRKGIEWRVYESFPSIAMLIHPH